MPTRGLALTIAAALLCSCKSEKPPPPAAGPPAAEVSPEPAGSASAPAPESARGDPSEELNWTAVSPDNQMALIQNGDLRGQCTARCTRTHTNEVLWTGNRCFGKRIDLRFVSNDCEKVVVIHQLPKASGIPQTTVVGQVFKKDKLDYTINAGATVRDWKKVRSAGTSFYWLAGVLGVPGTAPAYTADGNAVALETIDGKKHTIPLTVKP